MKETRQTSTAQAANTLKYFNDIGSPSVARLARVSHREAISYSKGKARNIGQGPTRARFRDVVNHEKCANLLSFRFTLNQKFSQSSRGRNAGVIPHLCRRNSAFLELFSMRSAQGSGMSSHKARVFRHRAEEFRELALSMGPGERQAMLLTADDYDRIALLVEKDSQQFDDHSQGHHIIDRLAGGHGAAAGRSA